MAEPEYKKYNQIRATKSGIAADIEKKKKDNYPKQSELACIAWIETLVGVECQEEFTSWLKDGTILCELVNVLSPGSIVKKIKPSKMPFKQMEAIDIFLKACEYMGVLKVDLFVTIDLYEESNPAMVISCLQALDRISHLNGYDGPSFAPKQSTYNPRNFSEEQVAAGKVIIGGQYGSHTGASQKGSCAPGTRRGINSHSNM